MKIPLCFKSVVSAGAIMLFAAVSGSSAHASTLWDFSATGACGEVFSGSFVTDNSGLLTSSSITGRGGCLSLKSLGQGNQDGNFTNIGATTPSTFALADNPFAAGDDNLFVSFVNALTSVSGGTVDDVIPYDHGGDDGTSFYLDEYGDFVGLTSGTATSVAPEPDSVLLLGSGLIPIFAMWRNRRKALRSRSPLQ